MEKIIKSRKRSNRIKYEEIILRSIFAVGILSVSILVPNALRMIKIFEGDKNFKARKYLANKKIFQLQRSGLIYFVEKDGNQLATLTKKGEKEIEKYLFNDVEIKKPKRWDGKWRIVSFDIKNYRTSLRNILRFHLKRLGFVQYQKSIWIYPYDCEDVIAMMKSYFKFGKEVMYIVAEYLENDESLKKEFGLR